jgi:hypothetical protein
MSSNTLFLVDALCAKGQADDQPESMTLLKRFRIRIPGLRHQQAGAPARR